MKICRRDFSYNVRITYGFQQIVRMIFGGCVDMVPHYEPRLVDAREVKDTARRGRSRLRVNALGSSSAHEPSTRRTSR